MNKILPLILLLLIVHLNPIYADDTACSYFYSKISELPHIKLTQTQNGFQSISDGKWNHGCKVVFTSHASKVSGELVYDQFQSFVNGQGWRIDNNISADGPGSSSVGIENDRTKCTIAWSQHAWIDEKTGEQKQSSDIELIIQCSPK